MIELRDYLDPAGRRPIRRWLDGLDWTGLGDAGAGCEGAGPAFARQSVRSEERRRPGYRLYFGRDGEGLIILLVGGSKGGQQRDIETARACWEDYKRRKRGTT